MRLLCVAGAAWLGLPLLVSAQTAPPRPPITAIAKVSVYAADLSKSRHFYGEFLGFPENRRQYRVNAQQTIQVDPLPAGVSDHLESVAFSTADVKALRRYLLGKGVSVPAKVQKLPDGSQALWVQDPEGHRIGFIQAAPPRPRMGIATRLPREQVSGHILHAGFIVHNRAAEDHFFRDILGFHQGWQGGMTDSKTDWVDMQVPDGSDWIEYMLHDSAPPTAAESGVLNHFALGVASMHEAMELLEQRGWNPSGREKPQIGRDGKWQLNLYDPDGTRVELMEFRPVERPCCSPYTLPVPQ